MSNEERLTARLGDLFTVYGREMTQLGYLLTGDPEIGQDLAQEAFIRLFARFGHLRNPDAVHGYLRRTVVNLARSHFRRRKTERAYLKRAAATPTTVEAAPDRGDDSFILLQELPPNQRAALILRFYFDLSEQQTAEALDVSAKAVNGLVSRGLSSVRERYRADG